MDPRKTTLERAFELALSGEIANMRDLRQQLKSEGYSASQLEGPALVKQLRQMIRGAALDGEPG
jgi:hypothetical protein